MKINTMEKSPRTMKPVIGSRVKVRTSRTPKKTTAAAMKSVLSKLLKPVAVLVGTRIMTAPETW